MTDLDHLDAELAAAIQQELSARQTGAADMQRSAMDLIRALRIDIAEKKEEAAP